MNSAFVGYEELSRSRRALSTEAEGRGGRGGRGGLHPPLLFHPG